MASPSSEISFEKEKNPQLSEGSRDERKRFFSVTLRVLLFGPIQGTIFWPSVTVTLVVFGQNQPYLFVHKDGRLFWLAGPLNFLQSPIAD